MSLPRQLYTTDSLNGTQPATVAIGDFRRIPSTSIGTVGVGCSWFFGSAWYVGELGGREGVRGILAVGPRKGWDMLRYINVHVKYQIKHFIRYMTGRIWCFLFSPALHAYCSSRHGVQCLHIYVLVSKVRRPCTAEVGCTSFRAHRDAMRRAQHMHRSERAECAPVESHPVNEESR